jgi:hypothetical protein
MLKTTTFAILFILNASIGICDFSENTSTMRCNGGIISLQDSFHEVQEKCGQPTSFSPGIWVYDFGKNEFVYMLKFNGGRVYKIINTGKYGFK